MRKTDNERKQRILGFLFYSFLFSPLFFYLWLFDRPEMHFWGIIMPLYGFWGIMMSLDMKITLSLKGLILKHEANPIFRALYAKYRTSVAVTIQIIIEAAFVFVLPSLMFPRDFGVKLFFDYQSSAIFAGIIGVFHLVAWRNNKRNIKEILENKKYQ